MTDANGHTTTLGDTGAADGGYDPSGQPTRVLDPTGAAKSFTYDYLGRKVSTTDALGKVWAQAYDLRGNPTRSTDPLGRVTLACYDANDNAVLSVGPRSPSPSCGLDGTDGYSTRTTYDARDLMSSTLTASDGQRRKSIYSYADDGELSAILEPKSFDPATGAQLPAAQAQRATYLRYANNRVSAFIDEEGARTDISYTPHGLIEVSTEPPGSAGRHSVAYTYTKLAKVRSKLESGHTLASFADYNLHGELTVSSTPLGNTNHMAYDKAGRLTTTTNGHGRAATRAYDPVGNLISLLQPTGVGASTTVAYSYTARNEIATESDPADAAHTVSYEYDPEGRQSARHDRYGGAIERSVSQSFFADGRLKEKNATFAGRAAGGHRTGFSYDADGNTTAMNTYSDGATTPNVATMVAGYTTAGELRDWTETIFANGAPVAKSSAYSYERDATLASRTTDGATTTYAHDRRGAEVATTPWGNLGSFQSTYYQSGSRQRQALPNGARLEESYDGAERLRRHTLTGPDNVSLASWSDIAYDDDDNRLTENVSQRQADTTYRSGPATNVYDGMSRLLASKHPFEDLIVPYALDDAANVVTEAGALYDYAANRLTQRSALPSREVDTTYGYDHFGNRTTETSASGIASVGYDAASHTDHRNEADGAGVSYAYDGADRLVRRLDSTNTTTLFFHDGMSDQVSLETDAAGTPKARYVLDALGTPLANEDPSESALVGRGYYVTDPRGNLTQLLDHNSAGNGPQVVATFAYGAFGQDRPALGGAKERPSTTAKWDSRLRFQLAPKDPTNGQYTLGPRLYDPATYRFVGADVLVGSQEGMELQLDPLTGNRYLYAGANPANYIDDGHGWCWAGHKNKKKGQKHAGCKGGGAARAVGGVAKGAVPSADERRRPCVGCRGRCCRRDEPFLRPDSLCEWLLVDRSIASAGTLGNTIVCRRACDSETVAHESVHVRQFQQGGVGFVGLYVWESFFGGIGCGNKYERPAYGAGLGPC